MFKYIPILFLFSCSVTNKHRAIEKTITDSLSIVHVDSVAVKTTDSAKVFKDNTITITDKTDNYKEVTVFEFDTTNKADAADYFPPIKKITVTKTGTKKETSSIKNNILDSSWYRHKDSVVVKKDTKTDLHKKEIKKDVVIKRTSYWGWLWLLLMIPAYLIYRNWPKIKLALKFI